MAELITAAAEALQADRLTAGHAALIGRLPQEQQQQALDAAFREDWRTKEKYAVSVRELSQWIRENLMSLVKVVFDPEVAELGPTAGSCVACAKRTSARFSCSITSGRTTALTGECPQSALDLKLAAPDSTWLRIAHDLGYHDKMHMVRDFHLFAGLPPQRLLSDLGDARPEGLALHAAEHSHSVFRV